MFENKSDPRFAQSNDNVVMRLQVPLQNVPLNNHKHIGSIPELLRCHCGYLTVCMYIDFKTMKKVSFFIVRLSYMINLENVKCDVNGIMITCPCNVYPLMHSTFI